MAQRTERRIAGTKIVEGDADAEVLQIAQYAAGDLRIAHHRRFGDLDLEPIEREPTGVDFAQCREQQRRVVELARRDIDADPFDHVAAVERTPYLHAAHHLADRPAADRHNQSALL